MTTATDLDSSVGKAGRQLRTRAGSVIVVVTLGLLGWMVYAGAPWYARLAIFLPAMAAGLTLLQVTRHTCVRMAGLGVYENEDMSHTKVSEALAAASRKTAATIYRDAALIGTGAAAVSALTVFIR